MAITSQALRALENYAAKADLGSPGKITIHCAVKLTDLQHELAERFLKQMWHENYVCPTILNIKPLHGYISRVVQDKFTSKQYIDWMAMGCSDQTNITIDRNDRPRMESGLYLDFEGPGYKLLVPIRSDATGSVYIDGVVPKGLLPGTSQKQ